MAGTPLASPSDLCIRLGVETPEEGTLTHDQLIALLDDASGEMKAVIGQELTRMVSTVHVFPDGTDERRQHGYKQIMSWVMLPATPVNEIIEVVVEGTVVPARDRFHRYHTLFLPHVTYDSEISVTYDHGFDPLPDELVKWTCVLAAATLSAANKTGALGVTAGISQHSMSIDDYTEGWANYSGYKAPGMSVPPEIGVRLRALYGGGGISVVSHR